MKDLYPYSVESLEEMFSLRKGDIPAIIKSEGVPLYSPIRNDFIGYLPSLSSAFRLDYASEMQVYKNISKKSFEVTLTSPVLTIKSKEPRIPSTAFLFKNLWVEKAKELLDIEEFSILVSNNSDAPFFCGHDKAINRLSLNLDNNVKILKTKNFIKEWK